MTQETHNTQREKVTCPETIKLPFMLDFCPLEEGKFTEISQFFQNLKQGN